MNIPESEVTQKKPRPSKDETYTRGTTFIAPLV
jgi:hypothetical protein